MKWILFLLIFSVIGTGFCQKDTSIRYDAQELEQFYINADEVYRIHLKTSDDKEVIITSHSTGEYYNELALNMDVQDRKMVLTSQFDKDLQSGFDKLSAHKGFSVDIILVIPEGLEVFVKSNITTVFATGKYKYFEIELKSGKCQLTNFSGNTLINTYSGPIEVGTQNAVITASSRSGEVKIPEITYGKYKVDIHSISGNIRVLEN